MTKKKLTKKKQGATMGRPTLSELGAKKKINITIDPDLKAFLDKLESRSSFINEAIRKAMVAYVKKTRNKIKRKGVTRSKTTA